MRHMVVAGLPLSPERGHTSLALNEIADGPEEVPLGLVAVPLEQPW